MEKADFEGKYVRALYFRFLLDEKKIDSYQSIFSIVAYLLNLRGLFES
jgi:hypothetical protein